MSGLITAANQVGGATANSSPHNPSNTGTRSNIGQQSRGAASQNLQNSSSPGIRTDAWQQPRGTASQNPHNPNNASDRPDSRQQPHPYDHPLGAVVGLVAGVSQAVNAAGGLPQSGNGRSRQGTRQQSRPFDAPAFAAGVGQAITAAAALQGPLQEVLGNLNQSSVQRGRGLDSETLDAHTARVVYQCPKNRRSSRHETRSSNDQVLENRCTVCCEDFQEGEELRILPCLHRYHRACVDPWLREHRACPICKHNVV